jgi:5'-deoxynucleotidase YfbR-like HD superfamily hydrolase
MNREKIYASRHLAGMVKRYSTWPMLRQQTVAEHCWRVACIYVEIFGLPRAEILYYCLHHDSGELWAGDLPFLIKKSDPVLQQAMLKAEATGLRMLDIVLPELSELERAQVKISDLLEMHETGKVEYAMGNKFAEPIVNDTLTAAQKLANEICCSDIVNKWLMREGVLR